MSNPREVTDRLTDKMMRRDLAGLIACYASNAVLVTPEGTFHGHEQIKKYFETWIDSFSDMSVDIARKADWDDVALDEWLLKCTNSGDIEMPTGERVPATGKRVALRGIDLCTVQDDVVTEHHIYYDQVELLGQLDLLPS